MIVTKGVEVTFRAIDRRSPVPFGTPDCAEPDGTPWDKDYWYDPEPLDDIVICDWDFDDGSGSVFVGSTENKQYTKPYTFTHVGRHHVKMTAWDYSHYAGAYREGADDTDVEDWFTICVVDPPEFEVENCGECPRYAAEPEEMEAIGLVSEKSGGNCGTWQTDSITIGAGKTVCFGLRRPSDHNLDPQDVDTKLNDNSTVYDTLSYLWTFEDYSTSDDKDVQRTYNLPGDYSVSWKVMDYHHYEDEDQPDANDTDDQGTISVHVTWPSEAVMFYYDKCGRRDTMMDSRGLTEYEYDVLGRLIKATEPDGKWIAYEYDLNSNRTEMTVHLDAQTEHVTRYEYNNRNLLSVVKDQNWTEQNDEKTTYTYYDNGLVHEVTYPNGTKTHYEYTERNWLTVIENKKSDSTVIAKFTYSYDTTYWGKNGTRTRVVEDILKPNGNRISAQVDYEYGDLYRLTHEHRIAYGGGDAGVTYEYNYEYDAVGNRTEKEVVGGSTTTYTYDDANKMTSPGTFDYDDAGNTLTHVIGGVTTTYTWNWRGLMTEWQKTNETTIDFAYDGDGMRISKTPSGGTTTYYLLDGAEIAEEITGENVTSYVGPGLMSKITSSGREIYHPDGIGSTRAMSGSGQSVSEAAIYDTWGNLLAAYPDGEEFGYAGRYRYYADSTGLDYLKARYYDPGVGRFVSRDPIGYRRGTNMYAYVGSNPVMGLDPSGMFCIPIGACAVTEQDIVGKWVGTDWFLIPCMKSPVPGPMFFGIAWYEHYDKGLRLWFCWEIRSKKCSGSRLHTWTEKRPCTYVWRDFKLVTGSVPVGEGRPIEDPPCF